MKISVTKFILACVLAVFFGCFSFANAYDPGARFTVESSGVMVDDVKLAISMALDLQLQDNLVVVTDADIVKKDDTYQVDFTVHSTATETDVQLLTRLKIMMDNPQSAGYALVNTFMPGVTQTSFFFGTAVVVISTTAPATTTVPPTTQVATSWFTFMILRTSSVEPVNEALFKTLVAAIVGQPAERVYLDRPIDYYDYIYANITASFSHPGIAYSEGVFANVSQPDLVAALRKAIEFNNAAPSAAVTNFNNTFRIISSTYYGYTPTTPRIIIIVQQLVSASVLKTTIGNAVGVSASRVTVVSVTSLGGTLLNFTIQFTNEGEKNSLDLATALQYAFFNTAGNPFQLYLKSLSSSFQSFEGLVPLIAITTVTPLPSVRAEFSITVYGAQAVVSETALLDAIATAGGLPVARLTLFGNPAITYNRGLSTASFVLSFTPSVAGSDPHPADMLLSLRNVLRGDPLGASRVVFEANYPIVSQRYYGYTQLPQAQPRISIVVRAASPDTNKILNAVATTVGVVRSERIVDVLVTPATGGSSMWNVSFRFSVVPPVEDGSSDVGPPTPLALTQALQIAFFNAAATNNTLLLSLDSTTQVFESLVPLTTAAPYINKNIEWRIQRGTPLSGDGFSNSISKALTIPTDRVVIVDNVYSSAANTVRMVFTFTDEFEGTAASRYNLTYQLMLIRFKGAEDERYAHISLYVLSSESYGDWVQMLTVPPPNYNPVITVTMNVSSFIPLTFKQELAAALRVPTTRIDIVEYVFGGTPVRHNCSFQFNTAADPFATAIVTNVDGSYPSTAAAAEITAEALALWTYRMFLYRRDIAYYEHLERFKVVEAVFPSNFPRPEEPSRHDCGIVVDMPYKITGWSVDAETGKNITVGEYVQVDPEQFRADLCELVSANQMRWGWRDPQTLVAGSQMGLYFYFLPVADPQLPLPRQLTIDLQYSLAARVGPNIELVLRRYNITSRRFAGVDGITDAPTTTTRNPYLPPDPQLYSPYGPAFNRSGLTDAPALAEDDSNKTLIYAVVFGCLGAIVLAAGATVVIKLIMSRGKDHKATKYATSHV